MIQMLILMRVYDLPYSKARDYQLKILTTPCEGVKLRDLLVEPTGNGCEYIRGLLATEYLMWKTGDMKAGWTWVSQDAATAREAFEMAFPLDIDEFMEEADVYIDRELALWPKREWPS